MSKSHKKIALVLSSFIVAGLLLAGAVVALAASTSFIGELAFDVPTNTYSIGTQTFTVTSTTACTQVSDGASLACPNLVTKNVEATVELSGTVPYTATAIAELGEHTGVVTAITGTTWTVGGMQFEVSSALAGTIVLGDVAKVTYKNVAGSNVAVKVEAVATSTYVGKVIAMGATWQINGNSYTVDANTTIDPGIGLKDIVMVTYFGDNIAVDIAPYPTTTVNARLTSVDPLAIEGVDGLTTNEWTDMYDGAVPGDIVTVVYYEYQGVLIASEITLYAPLKNENSRCDNRQDTDIKIPPGIEKKLPPDADLAQVYAMFCQGFGWGEIMNAFKLSADNPEALLARKANGEGWGQIKKDPDLAAANENSSKGHSNSETNKPGKPDNSSNTNKPENPGNSDHNKDNNGKGKNK